MSKEKFTFVEKNDKLDKEQTRPSLTYWQDVWRRLKKNKLAIIGLIGVILVMIFALLGPIVSKHNYSDQDLRFTNTPPRLDIYKLDDDLYVYLSKNYQLLQVSERGELLDKYKLDASCRDKENKIYQYGCNTEGITPVTLDYSEKNKESGYDYKFIYNGTEVTEKYKNVSNKTYLFGSDDLGRDLLTRTMYGARISLTIALIAAVINLFIGVVYGSISGYFGGIVDTIMMRIVDIINAIPLVLYVILLLVILDDRGLKTIIITFVTVYWVVMARLVRGQTLAIKENEYVLAARTMGVKDFKIIARHIIPNALGPIVVSLTMMIPSAVFTEAFLSYIGLGISVPQASLGTLASDGAAALRSHPYQLMFPALTIAWMMLSFNFLGDGLRDALDPRLRKG